jgi:hypothetical protein
MKPWIHAENSAKKFGDGVEVFVQRDGTITVDDYDHK